jgi:YidC/Oxa1 family membrane protein insertase
MAGTMFFQSKMTMQDPKQKAMVYIMPIFMLLIFNQFPSGLNLYYTMFNVLTIFQQKFTDGTGKTKKNK